MAGITFREQQLLKLFRSCDERGQHVIEMLARNQAAQKSAEIIGKRAVGCEQAAAEMPHLRYVPVVSDALPEDAWSGRAGFVHRAVMEDWPDLSAHQVYACGAPIVVESAKRDFVARCHLDPDEFYADSFTSEADKHGNP